MKHVSFILCLLILQSLSAQPKKVWSFIFGGNGSDVCNSIGSYNDTMLVSVGKSASTSLGVKGVDDFLICQFKPNGDLIRLKTFGGPSTDRANAFTVLPGGNILVAGYTGNKGADVANFYGLIDGWVLGYNPTMGTKIWEKNYGGTNNDIINDIFFLEPGRVFLAGHTKSIDRDILSTPTKGGNDIFISSIDENGVLVKAFTFGGTKDESAKKILRSDAFGGQMLFFGESESTDMDFNGLNNGKKDIFILKINRNINKVFLTNVGGPGDDLFADAINLDDNGIIIFGTVNTYGGQVDSLKGMKDIWMTKVDKNGIFQWSKNIGGKNDDTAIRARLNANREIVLLANSGSKDQDITGNYGGSDVLVIKLDTLGNILWQKNYGGTSSENAGALCTIDGSIYFVAQSTSVNNDLPSTNIAAPDFWTVKLFECQVAEGYFDPQVCRNDTILILGNLFFMGKDTGTVILPNGSKNGCDSIIHVALHFRNESQEFISDSLCNEATITINNVIFDNTHTADTFKLLNHFGCDSLLYINFVFAAALEVIDTNITKDSGSKDGCIGITVDGGCRPYLYDWSNGVTGQNFICDLAAGTYKATVTDCKGCSREFEFVVGLVTNTQSEAINEPVIKYTEDYVLIRLESSEIKNLSLFNSAGQLVKMITTKSNELKIKRSELIKGVYAGVLEEKNGTLYRFLISN